MSRNLEESILRVKKELFGKNSVYLPVKKKIEAKGGNQNIPDGLPSRSSKFQTETVRLSRTSSLLTDPCKHIAVQILKIFPVVREEPHAVKQILAVLDDRPKIRGWRG